jgi:hypothetical protein
LHPAGRRVVTLVALVAALLLTAFAATASAAPDQYHGAQTHPLWGGVSVADYDREFDLLQQAGADSVRVDLSWSSLETDGKGQINSWYVDRVDTLMAHARARGLKVLATFWTTPCWASTAPDSAKQGCNGSWWDRDVQLYAPADPADYAKAAAYVAGRWQDDLAALEVWNEPNQDDFLKGSDPVGDYAALVKATYAPVKAAAPGVPVIVGAVAHSDGDWLQKMWDKGVSSDYYDGISIHPYNEWRDPDDPWQPQWKAYSFLSGVKWVHDLMVAHGDGDKGLWLTEFGFSTCHDGSQDCVSSDQQAQYTKDSFRIAAGWSFVRGAYVYNLRNQDDTPDRLSQYGLVNRDFSRKPAYAALSDALHTYYGPNAVPQPDASATTGQGDTTTTTGSGSTGSSQTPGTQVSGGTVSVIAAPSGSILTATSNGYTRVKLTCKAKHGKRCRGRLRLRLSHSAADSFGAASDKVGEAAFSIKNGKTTIRVKLTASARRLVARVGRLHIAAQIVTPKSSGKSRATTKSAFVLSRI